MIRSLLVILCFSAIGFAQPWGLHDIVSTMDSTQSLRAPRIALIDTRFVRIFYMIESPGSSELRTVLYDLESQQIIGSTVLARADSVSQNLTYAAADGAESWVMIYDRQRDSNWTNTYYLIGHGESRNVGTMGITGHPNVPFLPSYWLSDIDLAPRIGGGWLLTWVQVTRGMEDGSQIYAAGLNHDSVLYRQPLIPPENQLFGPYNAAALSISHDTSLTLTDGLWNIGPSYRSAILLRSVAQADSEVLDSVCTYDRQFTPLSLNRAADGTLLVYSEPNSLIRLDETGGSGLLVSLTGNNRPEELAFQSGYGYAGLWTNPSWILMGRLYENGTALQPGTFYWRDNEHPILNAALAIAANGKIYVVWTESENGSSNGTRLMIAWINWDTPLSTPQVSHTQPTSFALAAFPNPFNSRLEIAYSLPRAERVDLNVYNVLGQKIATLFSGKQTSGNHNAVWEPACGGGVYFLALKSETQSRTAKIVYLK